MPEFGLSVAGLAKAIGVSRQSVNELLGERRGLSTDMAVRLGRLFDMSAEFWLNSQREVDLWEVKRELRAVLPDIRPLRLRSTSTSVQGEGSRLAALGGSMPKLEPVRRRKSAMR